MEPSLFDVGTDHAAETVDEVRALVALSMVPGVGQGRIRALLARFGSAEAALYAPRHKIAETPGVGPQTADAVARFDQQEAVHRQMQAAERSGARLITSWDPAFPKLLRQIYDPPVFLWVLGELLSSDDRAIAVVGTRRPTEYGRQATTDLAGGLAQQGFTIVSGLAYGIDAVAHRAALEAGGRTIAVLGSGVDRIYPSSHSRLAELVIQHGAILSEYPMGAAPDAANFPRRNRLVSGLALGTLVAEAYENGGALITARLAIEHNREVFAVPSPIRSQAGAGCNRLIQQGAAKLVMTTEDIMAELQGTSAAPLGNGTTGAPPVPPPDLSGVEKVLYDALTPDPVHIDSLCNNTNLDVSTALVYLLSLEFKGLVRQMAGKQFYRA